MQSNEIRIPKREFDLGQPCEYFKSSFARSLSSCVNQATKSLDFVLNFGVKNLDIDSPPSLGSPPPPPATTNALMAARSLLFESPRTDTEETDDSQQVTNIWLTANEEEKTTTTQETSPITPDTPIPEIFVSPHQSKSPASNNTNSDMEVLRLRKECQSLIEENRRLIGSNEHNSMHHHHHQNGGNSIPSAVENVYLHTQIDTLSWQLKQVESSRQMYKAVMEEVARFLEKCHRTLDGMQLPAQPPIGRSKSVLQVSKNHDSDSTDCSTGYWTRSSTSLADTGAASTTTHFKKRFQTANGSASALLDANSHTLAPPCSRNFSDLTWRRAPKRSQQISTVPEIEPEKLSKEAYRLFRTVQNLLNTREPSLLHFEANTMEIPIPTATTNTKNESPELLPVAPTFMRKMNTRESRQSTRSSTDDSSVHSASDAASTKTETDEDIMCIPPHPTKSAKEAAAVPPPSSSSPPQSTTSSPVGIGPHIIDDESGFSSMNSFQDIGVPLVNSTLRSMSASSTGSNDSNNADVANTSTATVIAVAKDVVGIPRISPHHRRWDSAPVTSSRLQLPADVSSQVLWV